jgi:hypothetical protein
MTDKTSTKKIFIATTIVLFLGGGTFCAWIANDNNLLQGATTKEETKKLVDERQVFLVQAFLVCGSITALLGSGALFLIRKATNRRDSS